MKVQLLFFRKETLPARRGESDYTSTRHFLSLFIVALMTGIINGCEKEPEVSDRIDLLTSYVWDNTESCGTVSTAKGLYTCIFEKNGTYRSYYKAFETFACQWRMVDYNTVSLDNKDATITELNNNQLILKGSGSFLGLFDIKCYYKYSSLTNADITSVGVSCLSKTSATLHGYLITSIDADISTEYGLSSAFGYPMSMNGNPVSGLSVKAVEVHLSDLMPETTYKYRFKAVDMNGISYYGAEQQFRTYNAVSLIDFEDNEYFTLTIGNQEWMAEPLRSTKYNDGTPIPYVIDSLEWAALESPAYCWYKNDPESFEDSYGALYNWFTVNTEKLCPSGWHVPTVQDVAVLLNYLGTNAGNKLTQGHYDIDKLIPYLEASNETGFSAVPMVFRDDYGFNETDCKFWCGSEYDSENAEYLTINNQYSGTGHTQKDNGLPVRCIKNK